MNRITDFRPTRAEINLDQLAANIAIMRGMMSPGSRFLAVVKANAYGHGLEAVADCAVSHGADMLGVAIAEEGIRLRLHGVTCPILILGACQEEAMDDIVKYHLTPAVFSTGTLRGLEAACVRQGGTCAFHFKIDTGMNRIGFHAKEDFADALALLKSCPHLRFDGMFTHFAESESADPSFTIGQASLFEEYAAMAKAAGHSPILHAANSGALLNYPQYHFDMVRGGIIMYGYHPDADGQLPDGIRPVLTWKTGIVNIKTIPAGETVSYGRTFRAEKPVTVATLPVGYGDGYKRAMSNHAEVLLHGQRCRQIGTICMDQVMVDISDVRDAKIGDEVVLLGEQGNERITADDLARWSSTISYEILLSISDRVPRLFPASARQ